MIIAVLGLLASVCYLVAVVFGVLGWIVNRPTDPTRRTYRLAAFIALAGAASFNFGVLDGFWKWSAFAGAAIWIWFAIDEWKALERCRYIERIQQRRGLR
jgi:hypothetical protein